MEVISEAPPPLPPKSSKVRQALKKTLESENGHTLPSSAVLKQHLIIDQSKKLENEVNAVNGIEKNHRKTQENPAAKPINGFRLNQNKSNHLIKSEVKPQRRFEFGDGGSLSNRTVKINNENDSPPPARSSSVTQVSGSQSDDVSIIAETYKTNFSNTLAKFVNGTESFQRNFVINKSSNGRIASAFSETKKENGPKIITWAEKNKENNKKLNEKSKEQLVKTNQVLKINEWNKTDNGIQEDEFLYQNVSNSGTNYIEYKLNGIISKESKIKSGSNRKSHKKPDGSNQYLMTEANNLGKTPQSDIQLAKKHRESENNKTSVDEKTTITPVENWKSPRTSQIEVRQVKNKTVVKISINDNNLVQNFSNLENEIKTLDNKETHFKPVRVEDEYDGTINDYQYPDVLFNNSVVAKPAGSKVNEYAEPFSGNEKIQEPKDTGNYQKPGQVYANIDKSKKKNRRNNKIEENNLIYENSEVLEKDEQFYANVNKNNKTDCYANAFENNSNEQFYANLDDKINSNGPERHYHNHAPSKEIVEEEDNPELVYANLNEEPECDQVYENQEFEILKNSKVTQSVIEKNPVPGKVDTIKRDKIEKEIILDQDVYENHEVFENDLNTYENTSLPQQYVAKKHLVLKEKPVIQKNEKNKTKSAPVNEKKSPKPSTRVTVKKMEEKSPEMLKSTKLFKTHFHFHDAFMVKENGKVEEIQNNSIDSGTCEVDGFQPAVPTKTKNGKVIVTINNISNGVNEETAKPAQETKAIVPEKVAQIDIETENHVGHKRAESLTSSGVGVDSEESDEEGSNISCDSLNSNELNGLSTSEDHGYHTPNSENKTGSPVDGDYQNISKTNTPSPDLKRTETRNEVSSAFTLYDSKKSYGDENDIGDNYENTDIIQQVANVAQKIKNLRSESTGIYLAKRIESMEDDTYENYRMFEKKPSNKKKQAPQPPTATKLTSFQKISETKKPKPENGEVKTLPKGLLQDIRSRNVRLSSAYPKGEKPEEIIKETPITKTIVNFNHFTNNVVNKPVKGMTVRQLKKAKQMSANEDKRLMVEERTYEERKTEPTKCEKVTTNKICAMEIDTDKFYKFHLFENREEVNVDKNVNDDETFAGVKDYLNREKPAAITSAKGTIRGVKNRVKAGIATFLQMQENKVSPEC